MKTIVMCIAMLSAVSSHLVAQNHPSYLHALSDLRAARWMLEHRPGNWQQTSDEVSAVTAINKAINEIKSASIDDGKDINDHPKVQEINEHHGRLVKALEWLRKARTDIEEGQDHGVAQGLRDRAYSHIDEAIRLTKKAAQA